MAIVMEPAGIIRLRVGLSAEELAAIRAWIAACHRASPSRSHIKDEGFLFLDADLRLAAWTSETGLTLDPADDPARPGLLRTALQRLIDAFLDQLRDHHPDASTFVRERSRRLQFNVLSYEPQADGTAQGVPHHQDRAPTTLIFNFLATRPAAGGALEVLDLERARTAELTEENWALVFDDRQCLHRVADMRGRRQSLSLRVWDE